MNKLVRTAFALALVVVPAGVIAAEKTPEPKTPADKHIDPQADRILREMTDYLARLNNFEVMSSTVDEVVTTDGHKVQVTGDHAVYVSRPNRLRSEQLGAPAAMAFRDDGKSMTLYCAADHTYATAPAPPTIDATIDTVRKQYQIDAPGADLLYSHPYDVLTEQVKSGQFIGKETVDGVLANHLAFRGEDVDWQIWIKDGPDPLPLRYVITTKTMKDQPEFSVRLSHWQSQANLDEATFQWQTPPGAKRVDSFPTSCGAAR